MKTGLIKRKSKNGYKQRTVKNLKFQLQLSQIIFHMYGEYIASSFEFVSSRTPEKNPFEKVYFYVFLKCHELCIDCWRTER